MFRMAYAVAAMVAAVIAATPPASAGYLIDPTGGTVLWGDSTDVDDITQNRALGFTFNFFGTPFLAVDVSTNGNLNFSAFYAWTNSGFPTSNAMIAPLWDDLYIFQNSGQKITEKSVAGQYYSVTWDVSQFSNSVPRYQFQVVLFGGTTAINGTTYLPDDIVFAYQRVDADFYDGNATIGLNKGDGTFATLPDVESSGGLLGNSQAALLPTASQLLLLARPDGSGDYGGAFVTAVPEPSTWVLAVLGIAACGWHVTRRNGRHHLGAYLMHFLLSLSSPARSSCNWKYLFALTISVTAGFGLPRASTADTVTLSAVDGGWYQSNGNHDPTNDNYIVGNSNGAEYRNFFAFDLTSIAQPITAASLRLWNPSDGYLNTSVDSQGFERYTLYDVTTNVTTLTSGSGGSSAFLDLGNGITFGGYAATSADNGTYVTIPLNAAGVTALNTANGLFAIGGAITTLNGDWADSEFVFGFTNSITDAADLILTVPEPSTLLLAVLGIAACGWRVTRRNGRTNVGRNEFIATALLMITAVCMRPGMVDGAPVYTQQVNFNDFSGHFADDPSTTVYDDFTLGASASVNSLKIWGTYWSDGQVPTPAQFKVSFHTGQNSPSVPFYSNTIAAASLVDTGFDHNFVNGANILEITLDLGSSVSFGPGVNYWLGIQAINPLGNDFAWQNSFAVNNRYYQNNVLITGDADVAFQLNAVPEPSTWVLCAGGLACTAYGAFRRRKRQQFGRPFIATALLTLVAPFLSADPAHAAPVTIDWVTVGDSGNSNSQLGYGSVSYEFKIGKYEVTIGQYAAFLNAVAKADDYGLYDTSMASDLNSAGISRTGSAGSYSYSVMNNGGNSVNRPITYVSWWDAARFANWMHNGQPSGPQGDGTTETGAYTLNGAISGIAPSKNVVAQFYIPTENEWFKAAYYNPTKYGAPGGWYSYYYFATQSDSNPGNTIGTGTNQANGYVGQWENGSFATGGATLSPSQNYLTDVGAYSNNSSYFGTFDQTGNVDEWNDLAGSSSTSRGMRGGSWSNVNNGNNSWTARNALTTTYSSDHLGFRLAAPVPVPEPSTLAMVAGGFACAVWGTVRSSSRIRSGRVPAEAA